MSKTICIIQGHPDPANRHYCHALADAYADGARASGHQVSRIEVAQLDFAFLRTAEDFTDGKAPPDIETAQDMINKADHLVILYPLWLGTMPAILKAFIEQVFRPGFALDYGEGGWPKKMLKEKSARVIVTMGMPALAYRWFYGAHSLKSLERNILRFCGVRPVRDTVIGFVGEGSGNHLEKWLQRIGRFGERGV